MTLDLNKPIRYRKGAPARILCTDRPSNWPIVSMAENGIVSLHDSIGKVLTGRGDDNDAFDLVNYTETETRTYYLNIYELNPKEDDVCIGYESRAAAMQATDKGIVARAVQVVITYELDK